MTFGAAAAGRRAAAQRTAFDSRKKSPSAGLKGALDKEAFEERFTETAVRAREQMREWIQELHAEDVSLDYLIREGTPDKQIPEVAGEIGADLIVIATDGRDNIRDFIAETLRSSVYSGSR